MLRNHIEEANTMLESCVSAADKDICRGVVRYLQANMLPPRDIRTAYAGVAGRVQTQDRFGH